MSRPARRPLRALPAAGDAPKPSHLRALQLRLADGAATTLHVASYRTARTAVRVLRLPQPMPLADWCAANRVGEAIVGGFFVRATGAPLGELLTSGIARSSVPFDSPWDERRECVHSANGRVRIARRPALPQRPRGDVSRPARCSSRMERRASTATPRASPPARRSSTPTSRSAAPRARRSRSAEALVALGAVTAINLDGGGSTSLVCGGRLRNRPREAHGIELAGGRPITTALAFTARQRLR